MVQRVTKTVINNSTRGELYLKQVLAYTHGICVCLLLCCINVFCFCIGGIMINHMVGWCS